MDMIVVATGNGGAGGMGRMVKLVTSTEVGGYGCVNLACGRNGAFQRFSESKERCGVKDLTSM